MRHVVVNRQLGLTCFSVISRKDDKPYKFRTNQRWIKKSVCVKEIRSGVQVGWESMGMLRSASGPQWIKWTVLTDIALENTNQAGDHCIPQHFSPKHFLREWMSICFQCEYLTRIWPQITDWKWHGWKHRIKIITLCDWVIYWLFIIEIYTHIDTYVYFLHDRSWISPWIKSISNELDITIHVIASQLSINCDVISNRLWRHQQNENRASETRGWRVKIVVFIAIYGFVMSCKK